MPSAAATAAVAPRRAVTIASVQLMTATAARGERSSEANPSRSCATCLCERRRCESRAPSPSATAIPHNANTGHHGSAPTLDAATTRAARASILAAASAAYTPPAVHMRPGPSIARAHSATFTASPSFAGANELTRDPTPSRAPACSGQMRPPAAAKAARHAATVQTNASAKPMPPSHSQVGLAPEIAPSADATRLRRSCGIAATTVSAASVTAERIRAGREMVIPGRSLLVTPRLAPG